MHQSFHTPRLERGYILVLAIIFFGTFFTVSSAYLNSITASTRSARNDIASAQALSLAEAGIDKAIYQLNQNSSYSGETNTALAPGTFTVTVSTIDNFTKQITATGYIPNNTNPVATKTIKVKAGINNTTVSFHYGVQSGQGGFFMDNSSTITGNVFSGGPVIRTGQNNISGDVVSSGSSGLVYGINASKSVYAHTIGNASESTIVG
jgi:Tfp pilus assembly protein PilX